MRNRPGMLCWINKKKFEPTERNARKHARRTSIKCWVQKNNSWLQHQRNGEWWSSGARQFCTSKIVAAQHCPSFVNSKIIEQQHANESWCLNRKTMNICTQNAGRNGHSYTALTCYHICCANKRRGSLEIRESENHFFRTTAIHTRRCGCRVWQRGRCADEKDNKP